MMMIIFLLLCLQDFEINQPTEPYRVIDGDTVYAMIEVGLDNYQWTKMRMHDYDTWELNQPGGREAKAELEKILDSSQTIKISLPSKGPIYDKYGRLLVKLRPIDQDNKEIDLKSHFDQLNYLKK